MAQIAIISSLQTSWLHGVGGGVLAVGDGASDRGGWAEKGPPVCVDSLPFKYFIVSCLFFLTFVFEL
jgi:hypothetical protein